MKLRFCYISSFRLPYRNVFNSCPQTFLYSCQVHYIAAHVIYAWNNKNRPGRFRWTLKLLWLAPLACHRWCGDLDAAARLLLGPGPRLAWLLDPQLTSCAFLLDITTATPTITIRIAILLLPPVCLRLFLSFVVFWLPPFFCAWYYYYYLEDVSSSSPSP